MPWNNQDGGGNSPWGPKSSSSRSPDFEEILRRGQNRMRDSLPGGLKSGKGIAIAALVAMLIWLASGFYTVDSNEAGVELVFGHVYGDPEPPGLQYNWPRPIGRVFTPDVKNVKRVEIGVISQGRQTGMDAPNESLMLTGDENIINIQFVVFWVIRDPVEYLFNVRNPDITVKHVAESAMREAIGKNSFEFVRTQGRIDVQASVKALTQTVLDGYKAGIEITQVELQKIDPPASVIDAFRDVQAARADQESAINEAQAYASEVLERSAGDAQKIVRDAEAYKEETINRARGDSQRFLAIYREYRNAPEITRRRMYLETMERIMGGMNKILIDTSTESGGQGSAVPYLSLNELLRSQSGSQKIGSATGQR